MSTEDNKAIVRRFYEEVWNKGNLTVADQLLAPDVLDHTAPPGLPPGREGHKQLVTMFRTPFPDLDSTIEDQVAEGDTVVSRLRVRGTHQGEFFGVPPTSKQFTITSIDLDRIGDGKIVEHWSIADQLGLMQQLGIIAPMG
jgi:steroid delta-isomerase-like uncharacterized protein